MDRAQCPGTTWQPCCGSSQSVVSDAYRYDPFGVTTGMLGTTPNPYRFQGRLLEPTSGQYDMRARTYSIL